MTNPNFNFKKLLFFQNESDFIFTDLRSKYTNAKMPEEVKGAYKICKHFEDVCDPMYIVFTSSAKIRTWETIKVNHDFNQEDYFWCHDFEWSQKRMDKWEKDRNDGLRSLVSDFHNLHFVLYKKKCKRLWLELGLPESRMSYWDIKWHMTHEEYKQWAAENPEKAKYAWHKFPTEESYNDLYEIITQ